MEEKDIIEQMGTLIEQIRKLSEKSNSQIKEILRLCNEYLEKFEQTEEKSLPTQCECSECGLQVRCEHAEDEAHQAVNGCSACHQEEHATETEEEPF